VTRRQAYARLFVLVVGASAVGFASTRDLVLPAVMAGVVFATGLLAVELGLGRRRPRLPDESDRE
jgi:hypothetical protein